MELEGVDGTALLTKADVVSDARSSERVRTCLAAHPDLRAERPVVVRVGVIGESVTVRVASGRALLACDNGSGPREDEGRWCGSAYGTLSTGRLTDPRLDVLCTTADDRPLGFVWVEPGPRSTYVAVRHPAFVEVYEVVGALPVRIATSAGVDVERSAATLAVAEHDAEGTLLRRYTVRAAVAG